MAVNPWGQQSDENIEGIMAKAGKQVKKAVSDTVKAVATDVKQQVTGDLGSGTEQNQTQGKPLDPAQSSSAKATEDKHQALLEQTRQNLQKINDDIQRIRQERIKKEQEVNKKEEQKKEQKKQVEKKKQEEPAWKRMLKGKMGSREAHQRAGG
mgnify:CR=1 FL=1